MKTSIIQIWKNRGQIIEGIQNNLFKKEHVEEISMYRMNICNTCDAHDSKGKDCAIPGTQPCCSECGCSLMLKTRSLSTSCPKGLWESVLTEREEDLLMNSLTT